MVADKKESRIRALWRGFSKASYFIYARVSLLVTGLVGFYFTLRVFQDYKLDTTALSNTAFAIVASLAALSFSCARALDAEPETRDRFAFAGERCFHSAVMLLVASVLKYALLSAKATPKISSNPTLVTVLDSTLGLMAGVLFFWAMNSAHTGVRVINEQLFRRYARHPDWDDLI
ncbi:MAG: hypothetical protein HYY26_05320 [Acidobacteria bacterium]|nr:hypothetical protein [Acidobacteriota bacterium]